MKPYWVLLYTFKLPPMIFMATHGHHGDGLVNFGWNKWCAASHFVKEPIWNQRLYPCQYFFGNLYYIIYISTPIWEYSKLSILYYLYFYSKEHAALCSFESFELLQRSVSNSAGWTSSRGWTSIWGWLQIYLVKLLRVFHLKLDQKHEDTFFQGYP